MYTVSIQNEKNKHFKAFHTVYFTVHQAFGYLARYRTNSWRFCSWKFRALLHKITVYIQFSKPDQQLKKMKLLYSPLTGLERCPRS